MSPGSFYYPWEYMKWLPCVLKVYFEQIHAMCLLKAPNEKILKSYTLLNGRMLYIRGDLSWVGIHMREDLEHVHFPLPVALPPSSFSLHPFLLNPFPSHVSSLWLASHSCSTHHSISFLPHSYQCLKSSSGHSQQRKLWWWLLSFAPIQSKWRESKQAHDEYCLESISLEFLFLISFNNFSFPPDSHFHN